MKNKLLLAGLAILYQVSQSNSWVNEKLKPFKQAQNLERTVYKDTHDKYSEISIKREGGLKKIVSFSNASNEAPNKKFNAKKQKLHELRRLRKARSNETIDSSFKDIVKLRKFTSDFDLKYSAKSNENKTIDNSEENNSNIKKSKEEFNDTNLSHEYRLQLQPISLSVDDADHNKGINSSSGDQNQTTFYRNNRMQTQFRHLWGQDRSIHSYRSASMHKKPFWYSPYHFPRSKVTVAGLNIPWFRLRSTPSDQDNIDKEPVQISKPDNNFQIQQNNTANFSTTVAPIETLVTYISNIAEQSITSVNIKNLPSQTLITLQPRLPHWPNFYKNMDTSEKSFKLYKSIKVATKPEDLDTELITLISKTEAANAASFSQKTTQGYYNKINKHAKSRRHESETTTSNMSRISNPGAKVVEITTVDNKKSTNIKLQNVTPRVTATTLKPIREPQWPPWPQWLSEPLQKKKNVYNGSYVLNEYTANVYSNEKSVTIKPVKLNDATETTKNIEETGQFFDIASTYSGITANIAALIPVTTGVTVVTTTVADNYTDNIDENRQYSENNSTVLPNLWNVVRCTQSCPLTPEFNPVCGTDDITYTNPGRLLCLQFCGLDVKVKKYQPCSSKHKLSEYPNMINLFINTAVDSLRETLKINASAPEATVNGTSSTPKATVKAYYFSTPSPENTTTVYYVKYDSFSMIDDDEETEAKAVPEATTEMTSRNTHKQLTDTTVPIAAMKVTRYIEKLKELIHFDTDRKKQSTTTNGPSEVKDVTHSSKKIESNLAALNNMLKHSGRDASKKAVHAVTYPSRDVATKRFSVTRAIKDVSTKIFKINFPTNTRKSSSSKNNLIHKQDTPHVDAHDSVDEPNNNGRRFVESPFVDLPYSSGEYVSPDENNIEMFQDNQKDPHDGDVDIKFWGYQSEKEKHDVKEETNVKKKTRHA